MDNTEQTYGEMLVGKSFNPSGNKNVDKLKALYAEIIDIHNEMREEIGGRHAELKGLDGEKSRLHSLAITEAETASMRSVKAVTYEGK